MALNPQLPTLSAAEIESSRAGDTQGTRVPGKTGTNDDSIGTRSSGKTGTNDDSIGGGGTTSARTALVEIARPTAVPEDVAAATADLSPEAQAQVKELMSKPNAADVDNAAYVMTTPTFGQMSVDQREKLINVMAKTDSFGVETLAVAAEKSGLSTLKATDGSSVVDNLNRMANTPGLGPYIGNVVDDIIRPNAIHQGNAPTCTAATMQYELAKGNPAEYSRLIAGLAIDGKVTMAGGGVLETQPGAALTGSAKLHDRRTPSESVFQGALMEFANGDEKYDVSSLKSTRADGSTHLGLNGAQIQTALNNLFAVDYKTTFINSNDEAAVALGKLNTSLVPNRPVLVDLAVDANTNHCVAFEGFKNGVVSLRDPERGISFTISEQDFLEQAAAVHIAPQTRVVVPRVPRNGRGDVFAVE